MTGRILIVDHDRETISLLSEELSSDGWGVIAARDGAAACAALACGAFDVVLTELSAHSVDGLAVLREVRKRQPGVTVIVSAAWGALRAALEAVRHGAYDYVIKPLRADDVKRVARRAIASASGFGELIGRSRPMRTLFDQIRAVARSDAAVLLSGPSGSGKELVARAIHQASHRAEKPLVAVNCGALPWPPLEWELFGHEPEALAGADRPRHGLIAAAHGGTLLLDEVDETPAALQVRLLRVIQDRRVRPVGGHEDRLVDFRVVAASNVDLAGRVREGRFREDLFYRLAVIPIRVPSLRERPEDIPLLARHFLARAGRELGKTLDGFEPDAAQRLLAHSWPGNVRELENVVQRAAILSRGPRVRLTEVHMEAAALESEVAGEAPTLAEIELRYIRQVLTRTNGDKRQAARILGVSVRTLQRLESGRQPSRD